MNGVLLKQRGNYYNQMCVTMKPKGNGLVEIAGERTVEHGFFCIKLVRSLMKKPKWERNNMHNFGNKDLMKPNPGNVLILRNARFMQGQSRKVGFN